MTKEVEILRNALNNIGLDEEYFLFVRATLDEADNALKEADKVRETN